MRTILLACLLSGCAPGSARYSAYGAWEACQDTAGVSQAVLAGRELVEMGYPPDGPIGRTTDLGAGQYRVTAFVDVMHRDSVLRRHPFSCVAQYDGGRYAVTSLTVAP